MLRLAWVRVGVGVFAWACPGATNRLFLVPRDHDSHSLTYMNRIFGVRAVALGLGYLLADRKQRTTANALWLMVDGADTVMGGRMAAAGELTRAQTAELLAVTGAATAVDVAGLLVRP